MKQNTEEFEEAIEDFANQDRFIEAYNEELNNYANDVTFRKGFDERLAKGEDLDALRDDINEFLFYDLNLDELPDDYPLEDYKKWINEKHKEEFSFEQWCSDNYNWIEEEYYKMYDEIYDEKLAEIEHTISKYILEKPNVKYDEETSHSWGKGRFPSVYFTFIRLDDDGNYDTDYDEITLRVSDGHDNGRSSDYEIVFDEYEESELIDILDDIMFTFDIERN